MSVPLFQGLLTRFKRPSWLRNRRNPTSCPRKQRSTFAPRLEMLEDRTCPSTFYDYTVMVETGTVVSGFKISQLGNAPSINDHGDVAFQASTPSGQFVVRTAGLNNYLVASRLPTSTVAYGAAVSLNNSNQILAREQYLGATEGTFALRLYDASTPNGGQTLIASAGQGSFDDYDAIGSYGALNNANTVAFPAVKGSPPKDILAVPVISGVSFDEVSFDRVTNPRPAIADDGRVVVKAGPDANSPIRVYDSSLGLLYTIPSTVVLPDTKTGTLTNFGRSPGISADGNVVVFSATRGSSQGIFAYIRTFDPDKVFRIAEVGTGRNGILDAWETFRDDNYDGVFEANELDISPFSSTDGIDGLSPVAVNSTGSSTGAVTIVYAGKDASGHKAIFSSRLSSTPDPELPFQVSPAMEVAYVGMRIPGFGTVTDLNIHDPVNSAGVAQFGQVAFWAKAGSKEGIIRAEISPDRILEIGRAHV